MRLARMMRDPHKAARKAAEREWRRKLKADIARTTATVEDPFAPKYPTLTPADRFARATANLTDAAKLALLDAIQKGYATA